MKKLAISIVAVLAFAPLFLIGIATYVSPFVLGFLWLLRMPRFDELKDKRVIAGWASVVSMLALLTGVLGISMDCHSR
jgi:hypothetical protein